MQNHWWNETELQQNLSLARDGDRRAIILLFKNIERLSRSLKRKHRISDDDSVSLAIDIYNIVIKKYDGRIPLFKYCYKNLQWAMLNNMRYIPKRHFVSRHSDSIFENEWSEDVLIKIEEVKEIDHSGIVSKLKHVIQTRNKGLFKQQCEQLLSNIESDESVDYFDFLSNRKERVTFFTQLGLALKKL